MKRHPYHQNSFRRLLSLALAFQLGWAMPLHADTVALATAPLASSTTTTVKPNLLFIMDNSGSMSQDYTPDWMGNYSMRNNPWKFDRDDDVAWNRFDTGEANEKNCKDSADDDGSIKTGFSDMDRCWVGDVPYMTSSYNSQYYNPAILYKPGVNFDGSPKPNQTDATKVLLDGYDKHNQDQLGASGTTIDLTTNYPDRVWCTKNNPSDTELSDNSVCRKNSNYLYPDATYKYGRDNNGTVGDKNVLGVKGAPYYYSVVVSEYCTEAELRNCVAAAAPTGSYIFPATARWCSDTGLSTCQSIKTSTYKYPRYVGAPATVITPGVTGVAAVGEFRVGNNTPRTITSVKVGGVEILGASVTGTNRADLATKVVNQINTYSSTPEYSAVLTPSTTTYVTVTSTVAAGAAANGTIVVAGAAGSSNVTNVSGGVTAVTEVVSPALPAYTFARTNIVSGNTYPKAVSRTDCTTNAGSCTYAEEITNFANWYAYYRTRMQAMKSSVSLAFRPIGTNYRVGFIDICKGSYLPVADFESATGGQKSQWYKTLFDQEAEGCGTPLRMALATAGRIFAGKELAKAGSQSGTDIDPMQYSCQQNFALLTTDGYWNYGGYGVPDEGQGKTLKGALMGNLDNVEAATPRPMYEGNTATGTLADVAMYYYNTDLRTSDLGNCDGSVKDVDVCKNEVFTSKTDTQRQQHMTTFTLGLGVDGTLSFSNDYQNATSGDFYNLKNGLGSPTVNWPVPAANSETAVDDLWHAAINGRGTYFSAKDPAQLGTGLATALAAIGSKIGASSAAATSTLNPVAGDNYAFVASYSTVVWTGNLEARTINVDTGVVSDTAVWCAENVTGGTCAAPSTIETDSSGSSVVKYCVTKDSTAAKCQAPGVLVGTDCKVELPTACSGTMASLVKPTTDTRTIYKAKADRSGLEDFTYANLNAADFTGTGLSQWALLDATQKTTAAGANLVKYLRGQTGFENRGSNPVANRLYRFREATLGDPLESEPFFISKPVFSYADPGYAKFADDYKLRAGTVYIGANDGMLHAFAADSGEERWAYVPTAVIPNMWKLADINYATGHTNFVNGSPTISDVCTANCDCDDACVATKGASFKPVWKTILVGGLNAGGRSYYALDITDPTKPSLLWEISSADADYQDLGYSFGRPVITKTSDGKWVVLLTSGYNNVSPGNGEGWLYVVDVSDGSKIRGISTKVGDTSTPSGLAKVSVWNDFGGINNTAGYVYGGDLSGNVWRFDINSTSTPMLFATLKDASGKAQPITTKPELGLVNGYRVVFIGTGKYLEVKDLTDESPQTIYAIKDDNSGTLADARTKLVAQTLTEVGNKRTGSNNSISFVTDRGWYVDLGETKAGATTPTFVGERVNVDMKLIQGTLLAASNVPTNTVCSPSGYGWLNYFNYETGGFVQPGTEVSQRFDNLIVGFSAVFIKGEPKVEVVTSNNPTPEVPTGPKFKGAGSAFSGKRIQWRELAQ